MENLACVFQGTDSVENLPDVNTFNFSNSGSNEKIIYVSHQNSDDN